MNDDAEMATGKTSVRGAHGKETASAASAVARKTAAVGNTGTEAASRLMDRFTSVWAEMGGTGMMDYPAFSAACQRNMEALSEASRVGVEGAQLATNREIEMARETMGDIEEAMRLLMSTEPPLERARRYTELSCRAYERMVADTRELGDLIRSHHRRALDLVQRSLFETMAATTKTLEKHEGRGT